MRAFPYGTAAFCLLVAALLTGLVLAAFPPKPREATLTYWTFANTHYRAYLPAIKTFEEQHPGVKVDLQLVSGTAVTTRLQAAMWAGLDVPDLVEVEISSAGGFFRGPVQEIGFRDLTDWIHRDGLWDGMVQARFAPYTSRGRIFGLPHDVHPVMLAYRRDIFEQEGIDPERIQTWDDFVKVGRRVSRSDPDHPRYLMEMSDSGGSQLEMCLFQRGGGYFDPEGRCILDNEASVQTMEWYVPLVAGPGRIGSDLGGGQILTRAVEDGYLLCLVCPDWRSRSISDDIPRMSGKMALMPLPAVYPGGPRTSTWGGTMLGITKQCKHPELAWALALHLYLNQKELGERFRGTNIIPALRSAWEQPAFHEPRPYYSNQRIGELYAALAPHVPFQYTSPYIVTAKGKLSEALVACVDYYRHRGAAGFDRYVRQRLQQSADEVRRLMARNPY